MAVNTPDFGIQDSFEEYLEKKDYLSSSQVKQLLNSTQHYKSALEEEDDEEEKEHFIKGSAIHCLLLEPDQFHKRFLHYTNEMKPYPDKDFRNTQNKRHRAATMELAMQQGRSLVSDKMMEELIIMGESIRSNKKAMELMQGTLVEHSFYSELQVDESFAVKVRVRPDAINLEKQYYVSVKSTQDGSPEGFSKHAANLNYHVSEAFYMRVLHKVLPVKYRPKTGYMITIETKRPYLCTIYDINSEFEVNMVSDFLEVGNFLVNMALLRLKEARETNVYKGYDIQSEREDGILPLILPEYAKYKANHLII